MKSLFNYLRTQCAMALVGIDMLWQSMKQQWSKVHYAVGAVLLVVIFTLPWLYVIKHNANQSVPVPIEQSAKVSKVDTEVITPKVVKVYKPEAKKKLGLSTEVQKDDTKVVTSAVTVDYSLLKKQTVSSVLDTETGETITYVNEEPSPWLAHRSFGSASLAYGFKGLNPAPVVRLQVTQDVLQIKSLTFGAVATVDSDSDTFVGVRGTYRW